MAALVVSKGCPAGGESNTEYLAVNVVLFRVLASLFLATGRFFQNQAPDSQWYGN
jgi:hypothetical protein